MFLDKNGTSVDHWHDASRRIGAVVDVRTSVERRARQLDLEVAATEAAAREETRRRENRNFVQVYPKGFKRLRALMDEYPLAAKVYAFLVEHIDEGCGAVVASQELIADELGVSRRSIIRATGYLDEVGAVVRIRLGPGTVYAYALDPEEAWKSFDAAKDYAAFKTRTLARARDNGEVRRKLQIMLKGKVEPETSEEQVQ